MGNLEIVNTKSLKGALSKPREEQLRGDQEIVKSLAEAALHCRQELTDADYEIYLRALRVYDWRRVVAGVQRAMTECEFIPRTKDILRCMPEPEPPPNKIPDNLKVIREWDEHYSKDVNLHYVEYEGGYKQCSFVKAHQT